MRSEESAGAAYIRLIDDKTGLRAPMDSTEQLATFIDPKWVTGIRTLALAYMTYLPSTPELHPGYGVTNAQWLVFDKDQGNYMITCDQQEITLSPAGHLVFDHTQIATATISRIRNKLSYQPQTLQILGSTFTLHQACKIFAAFLDTTIDKIDDSSFKKTRNHFFKEVGAATSNHSGRPPKLYQLN